ncbi:hypothetical protein PCPL58_2407 [Pseudomonas cerasi]|uniref:Uncharacterized protein n=2 Tax=Pseudomonas cerasi TaxID=1583341 RepID=A0A193SPU9_9PSED|nr:hypothetical protein PCPL58_2407 [Pseudomonas cerasi]SOS20139.1 hypothetical protein PL963_02459 [Pseudomonas cerasi]
MDVNALADEIHGRFNRLTSVASVEWRKIFANAMGTFYSKGYTKKISKGFYSPVEDDQAPVPKRFRFEGDDEASEDGEINEESHGSVSDHLEAAPESVVEQG